ncbi:MAG TPA: hypothetical protein VGE76_14175 [Opitutaceae bacterium]
MHIPIPHIPPDSTPSNSLVVQAPVRDVIWDRPIFKAPPLEPLLGDVDTLAIARELRRVSLLNR